METTLERLQRLYPGRLPIVVNKSPRSDAPKLDKSKFLVPPELTLGQFIYIVRRRLELTPDKSLFLFVENVLPTTSTLMRELYSKYKKPDGFLYMIYTGESTFGGGGLI
jgi:GABA(A) receptor-associated protein